MSMREKSRRVLGLASGLAFGLAFALAMAPSLAHADEDDVWEDPKSATARGWTVAPAEAAADSEHGAFRRMEREITLGPRGSIARDQVAATVREHIGEVRFCIARAQQRNPALSGRIVVKYIVGLEGAVLGADIDSSTVEDERTERCVMGAVRRWTFPRPNNAPVILTHPFMVSPL